MEMVISMKSIKKKKIFTCLVLLPIFLSISTSFLIILQEYKPDYNLFFLSTEEKLEAIEPYKFMIYNFVKTNVEDNSTVLFFDRSHYLLAKPYLFPKIKCQYFKYRNEIGLYQYLGENPTDYIIIIGGPHRLAKNNLIFTKIDFYPQIYLLKINKGDY